MARGGFDRRAHDRCVSQLDGALRSLERADPQRRRRPAARGFGAVALRRERVARIFGLSALSFVLLCVAYSAAVQPIFIPGRTDRALLVPLLFLVSVNVDASRGDALAPRWWPPGVCSASRWSSTSTAKRPRAPPPRSGRRSPSACSRATWWSPRVSPRGRPRMSITAVARDLSSSSFRPAREGTWATPAFARSGSSGGAARGSPIEREPLGGGAGKLGTPLAGVERRPRVRPPGAGDPGAIPSRAGRGPRRSPADRGPGGAARVPPLAAPETRLALLGAGRLHLAIVGRLEHHRLRERLLGERALHQRVREAPSVRRNICTEKAGREAIPRAISSAVSSSFSSGPPATPPHVGAPRPPSSRGRSARDRPPARGRPSGTGARCRRNRAPRRAGSRAAAASRSRPRSAGRRAAPARRSRRSPSP